MRVLIQRVKEAKVEVDEKVVGEIGEGLLIFLGVHKDDTPLKTTWLANKVVNLRVFEDDQGKMNLSLKDVEGEALIVSQFTLYGNCAGGRRPDFFEAMQGEEAEKIYCKFVAEVEQQLGRVQTGQFGAYMNVSLVNDGPVTFQIEGK